MYIKATWENLRLQYMYCLKLSKMSIVACRFVGLWLVDVFDEVENVILVC